MTLKAWLQKKAPDVIDLGGKMPFTVDSVTMRAPDHIDLGGEMPFKITLPEFIEDAYKSSSYGRRFVRAFGEAPGPDADEDEWREFLRELRQESSPEYWFYRERYRDLFDALPEFEEEEHPRHPKGDPRGGQFAPKGASAEGRKVWHPVRRSRLREEGQRNTVPIGLGLPEDSILAKATGKSVLGYNTAHDVLNELSKALGANLGRVDNSFGGWTDPSDGKYYPEPTLVATLSGKEYDARLLAESVAHVLGPQKEIWVVDDAPNIPAARDLRIDVRAGVAVDYLAQIARNVDPNLFQGFTKTVDWLGNARLTLLVPGGVQPAETLPSKSVTIPSLGNPVEVLINPKHSDLVALAKEATYNDLRVFRDPNGNLYAWDAEKAIHASIIERMGYSNEDIAPYDTDIWQYRKGRLESPHGRALARQDGVSEEEISKAGIDFVRSWLKESKEGSRPVLKSDTEDAINRLADALDQAGIDADIDSTAVLIDKRVSGEKGRQGYSVGLERAGGKTYVQALDDYRSQLAKAIRDGTPVPRFRFRLQKESLGTEEIEPKRRLHPGKGYSKESYVDADGRIQTNDVNDAVRALYEDRDVVLKQPKQVSATLDRLAKVSKHMARLGNKAPDFNLCRIMVEGSSLFCTEAHGIPRVMMPQLKGVPVPGSPASTMPADSRGEVDVTDLFRDHLIKQGYELHDEDEAAAYLRPTQNQLQGVKVAAIANAIRNNKLDEQRLFISYDDYIVDGHHRWAAKVGVDFDDNKSGDIIMPVARVNAGIVQLLAEARRFTKHIGIPQASIKDFPGLQEKLKKHVKDSPDFDESEHPRDYRGRWSFKSGSAGISDIATEGAALSALKQRGFAGRPAVVTSTAALPKLRVFRSVADEKQLVSEIAGDDYRLGNGLMGRAIYVGTTRGRASQYGEKQLKGGLADDAKIADIADVYAQMKGLKESNPAQWKFFQRNPALYAGLRGYDAIRDPSGQIGVVNRTKLVWLSSSLGKRENNDKLAHDIPVVGSKTSTTLGQYVDLIAGLQERLGDVAPAKLMQKYGQSFQPDAQTYEGKRGKQGQCYMNAGRMALDRDDVTYVEGLVSVHGVPIEHAWVVDNETGKVLDPTLRNGDGIGEYFGVPIDTDFLRKFVLQTEVWGVFGYLSVRNLLKYKPEQVVAGLHKTKDAAEFEEEEHPRHPQGDPRGGQFAPKGGGSEAKTANVRQLYPKLVEVEGDDWNKETAERLAGQWHAKREHIAKLAKEAVGKDLATSETPTGWDELSSSAQEDIEKAWKEQFYDTALEHAKQYWFDEEAIVDARHTIVEDWNSGSSKHIDELELFEELRAARKDDGLPDYPYSNQDLAMALVAEYDPNGSSDTIEIFFNDKFLKKPIGYNEEQQTLPGVEPEDPAKRLTEEMRKELAETLQEKMEKVANELVDSGELEYPEYLHDSAQEDTNSFWDEMSDDEKYEWGKSNNHIEEENVAPFVEVEALPDKYDPLQERPGSVDYKRTQKLARYLSIERGAELLLERGLLDDETEGGDANTEDRLKIGRDHIAEMDTELWHGWKGASNNTHGQMLQLAAAEELGGRFRYFDKSKIIKDAEDADRLFASQGGFDAVKAYVRAKWEVTQHLLEEAGVDELTLYRGVRIPNDGNPREFVPVLPKPSELRGVTYTPIAPYKALPDLVLHRNGAQSFSLERGVANGWVANAAEDVVIRAKVPRTAVISVPAYGINVMSEREVVVAGTAWGSWDAWDGEAPSVQDVPMNWWRTHKEKKVA